MNNNATTRPESIFPDIQSEELFRFVQHEQETILGIGCDILEIERFEKTLSRMGHHFLSRIFTPREIDSLEKLQNKGPSFAARFTAKEALSKAIGTGIGKTLGWHDIEIVKDPNGKPYVIWNPDIEQAFSIHHTYLSMSHSTHYALSFCIITSKKNGQSDIGMV